jgi:hypothetical protein
MVFSVDQSSMAMIKHEKQPHVLLIRVLERIYSKMPTLKQINVVHSLLGALRNFCVAGKSNRNMSFVI